MPSYPTQSQIDSYTSTLNNLAAQYNSSNPLLGALPDVGNYSGNGVNDYWLKAEALAQTIYTQYNTTNYATDHSPQAKANAAAMISAAQDSEAGGADALGVNTKGGADGGVDDGYAMQHDINLGVASYNHDLGGELSANSTFAVQEIGYGITHGNAYDVASGIFIGTIGNAYSVLSEGANALGNLVSTIGNYFHGGTTPSVGQSGTTSSFQIADGSTLAMTTDASGNLTLGQFYSANAGTNPNTTSLYSGGQNLSLAANSLVGDFSSGSNTLGIVGGTNVDLQSAASDTVNANGSGITFSGSSNTLNLSSGTTVDAFGDSNNYDLNSANSDLGIHSGTANNVTGGAYYDVVQSLAGTHYTWNGSESTLNLLGAGASVSLNSGAANTTNANSDGVTLNTGVGDNIGGNNNTISYGVNTYSQLLGTGDTASVQSGDQVLFGASSSATLNGSGTRVILTGNGDTVTTSGNTVNIGGGLTSETVTGNNETFNVGSNVHLTVYGSGDTVDGGSKDNIHFYGSTDKVYADDSTIDFSNGSGDDYYGNGDSGYGGTDGDPGGGGGYGYGYDGYGGDAFASVSAAQNTSIDRIASYDASLGDQSDATIAEAAHLQAADAASRLGQLTELGPQLEGSKWTNSTGVITWSFINGPASGLVPVSSSLDTQEQAAVEKAFDTWAAASGLKFEEVADSSQSDIRVGFSLLGGADGTLGYTSVKAQNGTALAGATISLEDPAEDALVTDANGQLAYSGTDTELSQLALHEIGHALGLADDSDPNSIMAPVLSSSNRALDATDLAGLQLLYPGGSQTSVAASVIAKTAHAATSALSSFTQEAAQLVQSSAAFQTGSAATINLTPTLGVTPLSVPPLISSHPT